MCKKPSWITAHKMDTLYYYIYITWPMAKLSQLFGIAYLVGKIMFKPFFSGSIGWVSIPISWWSQIAANQHGSIHLHRMVSGCQNVIEHFLHSLTWMDSQRMFTTKFVESWEHHEFVPFFCVSHISVTSGSFSKLHDFANLGFLEFIEEYTYP